MRCRADDEQHQQGRDGGKQQRASDHLHQEPQARAVARAAPFGTAAVGLLAVPELVQVQLALAGDALDLAVRERLGVTVVAALVDVRSFGHGRGGGCTLGRGRGGLIDWGSPSVLNTHARCSRVYTCAASG
jgi:hypothetical protein